MRTTLDIDDDILAAAKEQARSEGKTMGQVISDLARKGLTGSAGFGDAQGPYDVDDWPVFARVGGPPVTSDLVRRICDEIDQEDMVPYDHERDAPRIFDDATIAAPTSATSPRTG